MLAGNEPPLAVARIAVRVIRWPAKRRHRARLLVPAQDAVIRNVAPQHVAAIAEPHGSLGPARALIQAFDGSRGEAQCIEAGIETTNGGIGIAALVRVIEFGHGALRATPG